MRPTTDESAPRAEADAAAIVAEPTGRASDQAAEDDLAARKSIVGRATREGGAVRRGCIREAQEAVGPA
eukprot:15458963-Alexandrium_andersonii.AAC.1